MSLFVTRSRFPVSLEVGSLLRELSYSIVDRVWLGRAVGRVRGANYYEVAFCSKKKGF